MSSIRQGSIHLFRVAGVDLFLHWSWFVVAAFEIESRAGRYASILWNVLEYLALFLIVLLHEFGHAMACRQTGGTANQIVLWPLGGVAYVNPPQRPGATLWSIAAGPLVNVVLLPILAGGVMLAGSMGWARTMPDAYLLLKAVAWINGSLLVFNMLPIYPLDGGQILRSLLWFVLGRARSLMVATVIGLVGIVGVYRRSFLGEVGLDRSDLHIHAPELLGRTEARTGAVAGLPASSARGVCVPELPVRATAWRLLAMRLLRATIRHVRDGGDLPKLRFQVCDGGLPGLWRGTLHQ